MNRNELLRQYSGNLSELRKIINSFDLIPEAPSDEFDKLVHKVLSQLDKGADKTKINNIIQSELVVTYGLFDTEFDATSITEMIIDWWNSKN